MVDRLAGVDGRRRDDRHCGTGAGWWSSSRDPRPGPPSTACGCRRGRLRAATRSLEAAVVRRGACRVASVVRVEVVDHDRAAAQQPAEPVRIGRDVGQPVDADPRAGGSDRATPGTAPRSGRDRRTGRRSGSARPGPSPGWRTAGRRSRWIEARPRSPRRARSRPRRPPLRWSWPAVTLADESADGSSTTYYQAGPGDASRPPGRARTPRSSLAAHEPRAGTEPAELVRLQLRELEVLRARVPPRRRPRSCGRQLRAEVARCVRHPPPLPRPAACRVPFPLVVRRERQDRRLSPRKAGTM